MPICQNLARALSRYKRERRLSMTELSEELGIAKSMLEGYLNGTGNPRADTLELLAEKCGVSIHELVSGPSPGREQAETLAGAAKELGSLPPERRARGIQLLEELAALFAENHSS